jgi:hypothetical protein
MASVKREREGRRDRDARCGQPVESVHEAPLRFARSGSISSGSVRFECS